MHKISAVRRLSDPLMIVKILRISLLFIADFFGPLQYLVTLTMPRAIRIGWDLGLDTFIGGLGKHLDNLFRKSLFDCVNSDLFTSFGAIKRRKGHGNVPIPIISDS